MASAEKEKTPKATELAKAGQEKRRRGITGWLLSRGFGWAAAGTLGAAAYLAIAGGTVAAAATAPLAVWILGGAAVMGASLFTAGVGRGIFVRGA